MNKEPIRHHYIPQFILRNFCFSNNGLLSYYDKKTKKTSFERPNDVFMVKNLYRDEINSSYEPTKIEKDLALYENEVAPIIKNKFLNQKDIVLTLEENSKLKLFFAIMGLRSKRTNELFNSGLTKESVKFYQHYQEN